MIPSATRPSSSGLLLFCKDATAATTCGAEDGPATRWLRRRRQATTTVAGLRCRMPQTWVSHANVQGTGRLLWVLTTAVSTILNPFPGAGAAASRRLAVTRNRAGSLHCTGSWHVPAPQATASNGPTSIARRCEILAVPTTHLAPGSSPAARRLSQVLGGRSRGQAHAASRVLHSTHSDDFV